jgi:CRP-like cAMP-binding protein
MFVDHFGEKVVELGEGRMFGEVALLKNAPRNATIIANSDIQLVVLTKKQFEMIKGYYSQDAAEKKAF